MRTITERVSSGAAVLDLLTPGWEIQIDIYELNMSSCIKCIAGQLFGLYTRECINARFPPPPSMCPAVYYYGFSREQFSDVSWDDLRVAWVQAIQTRLAAAAARNVKVSVPDGELVTV